MISKNLAKRVLNAALATGGDFAELFLEDTTSNILARDSLEAINNANSSVTYGAGLRILKGLQSVYGYTNDLSKEGLLKLADSLACRFDGKRVCRAKDFVEEEGTNHKAVKIGKDVSKAHKKKIVNGAYRACKNTSKYIAQVSVSLNDKVQNVVIINSDGKWIKDQRARVRLGISAIAFKDGVMETAFEGPGAQKGFEFFDEIDYKAIARSVGKSAITTLKAQECPSAKMDVIIENGFGGVIFHEACGHSLEASSVAKGLSVFCGKKGQKIASDLVTAVDDGTIENGWGSGNYDDEGNKTTRNVLIENGVLKSYLVDAANGRRMNEAATGCCRRESYKYPPTSRMSNTFICNGTSTVEEMIKATKKGLYCKKMGGGSVNPVTGEFNFALSEGYLIKNGKITRPVKGATLVGSGSEILLNIDMVGNNLRRAQGMCGSSSGSIPADVGQPCIRVRNITVGGRGGK